MSNKLIVVALVFSFIFLPLAHAALPNYFQPRPVPVGCDYNSIGLTARIGNYSIGGKFHTLEYLSETSWHSPAFFAKDGVNIDEGWWGYIVRDITPGPVRKLDGNLIYWTRRGYNILKLENNELLFYYLYPASNESLRVKFENVLHFWGGRDLYITIQDARPRKNNEWVIAYDIERRQFGLPDDAGAAVKYRIWPFNSPKDVSQGWFSEAGSEVFRESRDNVVLTFLRRPTGVRRVPVDKRERREFFNELCQY